MHLLDQNSPVTAAIIAANVKIKSALAKMAVVSAIAAAIVVLGKF